MHISLVPKEEVTKIWPQVEPYIKAALDVFPNRYEPPDVFIEILIGEQTLWLAFEKEDTGEIHILGCWTLRILDYPQTKSCLIEWVGGENIDEWFVDGMKYIEDYAKDMGCSMIEANGRIGWKPRVEKMGWTMRSARYEINLDAPKE